MVSASKMMAVGSLGTIGAGVITYAWLSTWALERLTSLIAIIGIAGMWHYYSINNQDAASGTTKVGGAAKTPGAVAAVKGRHEANTEHFYVEKFPSGRAGFKFLNENKDLVDIVSRLKFVTDFDRACYEDMLLYMDKYQKVYIYILAKRYPCHPYIDTFLDLGETVLEKLYSLVFVVPKNLKHRYDIVPYEEIKRATDRFKEVSVTMTHVLRNFCRSEDGGAVAYFPSALGIEPVPYEEGKQDRLP